MRIPALLAWTVVVADGASWADDIKAAAPAGLDQEASDLWQSTWTRLGAHFPEHELTPEQTQAIRVPLVENPGIFAQYAGAGGLGELRSKLVELQSSADTAAREGEEEFFLRLVPSPGTRYPDTVAVFDKSDHGTAGTAAGVNLFRIPSLCKAGKQLLAFSEARATVNSTGGQESGQDCVPTGIAMKSSTDGGQTWGAISYPVDLSFSAPTTNGLGDHSANPVTVWEASRQRVHLHYVKGARTADDCAPRSPDDAQLFFNYYKYSDDYGASWSAPIDISDQLGEYRGCMPGPDKGVAVRLSSGETRIVVPCHLGTAERENGETIVYYSSGMDQDVSGATWSVSSLGKGMDETSITAIPTGISGEIPTILASMRNDGAQNLTGGQPPRSSNTRAQRTSTDGGSSWSAGISYPTALPDPVSEGSLCTAGLPGSSSQLVLLSNAPMVNARAQLSLHMTADGGRTWGPATGAGGCIPVTDATVADTTASGGGARCRKVVDSATFSDYSSLWCAPQADTAPFNVVDYGVLWGTCSSPFPFQVWCQLPDAWSIQYSRGNFPVNMPATANDAGRGDGNTDSETAKTEKELEEHSGSLLVVVLCVVGGCVAVQFCRQFCRKRAVDGKVNDFMEAYTEDHRDTLAAAGGDGGEGRGGGLGSPLLAPKGGQIAASQFAAWN